MMWNMLFQKNLIAMITNQSMNFVMLMFLRIKMERLLQFNPNKIFLISITKVNLVTNIFSNIPIHLIQNISLNQ